MLREDAAISSVAPATDWTLALAEFHRARHAAAARPRLLGLVA
ncbi:MAG: hypothetical protein WDN06_03605 [Asticcacaulis sp.]